VQQRLGPGPHAHHAAVLGLQAVAVGQRRLAAFEKQADLLARGGEAAQTALAARLEAQLQFGVGGLLRRDSAVDHQHMHRFRKGDARK
jgi:hypothetical protein